MSKLKSLDELRKIREKAAANTILRTTGESTDRTVVAVGMATCGIAAGAKVTMDALLDELSNKNIQNVSVIGTGCLGFCYAEPLVEVRVPGQDVIRYGNVDEKIAREIISKHVAEGILVDNAIFGREVPNFE